MVEKDMKKAKEQLKIRQEQPDTYRGSKSKAEEVRLHFISVQPKGVDNFVCTNGEDTYPMSAWDGVSLPQRHFQRDQ